MTRKYRVLFLCRENSARSIIAEALLRELAGHRFEAFSAGAEPAARVHPLALAQLRPGISDLDLLSPKSWPEFTSDWAPRMESNGANIFQRLRARAALWEFRPKRLANAAICPLRGKFSHVRHYPGGAA